MHLFFDTVWKLHIGEIPEKPKKEDHATYLSYYPELFKYNEAIAAIKQNALPVGNPKLIEKIIPVPIGMSYKKDHFYPFKGGFETKEMQYRVSIIDGKGGYTPVQTVAILTLPEEKKNTMENITTSICPKCGNDLSNLDRLHFGMCSKCFAYDCTKSDSGSVVAPKEEGNTEPYFHLSKNEYGKMWLMYKPEGNGRYKCWEPITEEFWNEFEKLLR